MTFFTAQIATQSFASETESKPQDFDIDHQALGDALLTLAKQSNRQIFVRSSLLGNQTAGPVSGTLTVTEALEQLLVGTQLKGELTESGRIKVSRDRGYVNSDVEPSFPDQPALEEVVVTGLRYAWESSYQLKKNAARLKDVLSEADMGKLPDGNVADSLQRINGLQIERRNGDGTRFRIRGFDTNVTLYNGELFLTGLEYFQLGLNEQSYENSIETLPVELLRRIEVYKSIRASDLEGAIGGTIDLISRNAFDVEDYLITGDVKLDYGKFAKKARPEIFVGLGRNWDDTFSALLTLDYAERTMHMDLAENYIERNPFGSRSLTSISEFNDPDSGRQFDYLAPVYSGLADIEQTRSQVGASLNLGWRPNPNLESQFEWFGVRSDLEQRNYEWLTAVDGANASNYRFNESNAFPFLRGVDYETGDEIFRTVGEAFDTKADNLNVQTTFTPSERWELSGRISYSDAEFKQNLGNADLVTLFNTRFLPVWIGEGVVSTPGLPDVSSPTGWTKLFNVCASCQDPATLTDDFRYDLGSSTYTQLSDARNALNQAEDTYGALSQANAAFTDQDSIAVRADAKFFIDDTESNHIGFGFRFDNRNTEFTQSRYLTNLSETQGVARPTQFDADGNIIQSSDFSPSTPGDATNVGIALPTFYDLCGNGGLFEGQPCDIDGDFEQDNFPYGPWVYELNPTSQPDALNVFGGFFTPDLYGQDFGFNAPGYIPWRSFEQFPEDYIRLNDFYPSGSLPSNTASFVEGETISRNVAAWIDRMAPNSPSRLFNIPRNSWAVEQETRALYAEYNHASQSLPIRFNVGVRYVETDFEVERAVIESGFGISFTPEEWYESGVGAGWRPEVVKNTYRSFLPAANLVWDIDEAWKLRLSAAKTIARPSFRQLGSGDSPEYALEVGFDDFGFFEFQQATAMQTGNPNLKPVDIKQGDLSIEYYGDNASYAQLAFFYKGMEGQIFDTIQMVDVLDESDLGSSTVPVNMPTNVGRTYARGFEVTAQKTWHNGLGMSINYANSDINSPEQTISTTDIGLPGVSEQTFNWSGFFENDRFRVLLTYAWRDEFLAPYDGITIASKEGSVDSISLAHTFEAYGQWDAKFTYFHSDLVNVSLDLLNLTQSEQKSYLEFKENSRSRTVWEPRAILGVQLNF